MADTKLSSLLPEWRQASSTYQTFFKQISSRVASWLPVMRDSVLVDKGPDLFIPSSWDQLMASSVPQPHSPAASTALKFTHQKGALTGSLPEFVPYLGKCYPTRSASVGGRHPGGLVSSTNVEPHYVLSSATSTSHPLVVITLPPTVITPAIPTIVVTDVDGPPPSGINDNCPDQMYRAMTCGRGLLWSQWSGRFSPSRCGSEIGSRDGIYLQDQPGDDIEEFAEVANEDNENCFELHNGITLNAPEKFEVATSEKFKPILPELKELEWWEIEGGDDETGSGDEDSEDSSEGDSESESDSEFDEDKDEDLESDSEGDDYEYANDSNDDDSGEDSDLGESEDSENILALGSPISGLGALMPPPHQKPNSNIHTYTKDAEFVDRDVQDIKEGFLLPLPLPRPN